MAGLGWAASLSHTRTAKSAENVMYENALTEKRLRGPQRLGWRYFGGIPGFAEGANLPKVDGWR